MIYDVIENIGQYTGMFANLDTAIKYIGSTDLNTLPLGKTEIDGENVFVNVMEAEPKPTEDLHFETHEKYFDLQIDLDGTELFEVALGDVQMFKEPDGDTTLWDSATSIAGVLGDGRFVIFLTEEPHKPTIAAQGCSKVKKCVFKIKRD